MKHSIKRLNYVIISLAVIIVLLVIFQNTYSSWAECREYCEVKGYQKSNGPLKTEVIDEFDLGYYHKFDSRRHELECNVIFCDKTRKDFVYVNNGNITFTMDFFPGKENDIVFGVTGRSSCRVNEIFIDGKHIGTISTDRSMSGDIRLKLPEVSKERMRVTVLHNHTSCYGFDIYEIRTEYERCQCS